MKCLRKLVERYLSRRQSRKNIKLLKRKDRVITWYFGASQQLNEWGIIDYKDILTGKGHEYFQDLLNINFKPTDKEIMSLVSGFVNPAYREYAEVLFKDFRDVPGKIKRYCMENNFGCFSKETR